MNHQGQYRIQEMHQQIAVFLRARQCLEYTIHFGVYYANIKKPLPLELSLNLQLFSHSR